jgi:hypothetical protein
MKKIFILFVLLSSIFMVNAFATTCPPASALNYYWYISGWEVDSAYFSYRYALADFKFTSEWDVTDYLTGKQRHICEYTFDDKKIPTHEWIRFISE